VNPTARFGSKYTDGFYLRIAMVGKEAAVAKIQFNWTGLPSSIFGSICPWLSLGELISDIKPSSTGSIVALLLALK
jgi:hypothetical protein